MRSFDSSMPEELNRVLVDHASALLLCSSLRAAENLRREGVHEKIEVVGDVMVDVAMAIQPRARGRLDVLRGRGLEPRHYALATAHRAGNVDDPERLAALVELLAAVPMPLVFPVHPRTRERLHTAGLLERLEAADGLVVSPPLGYVELQALLCNARAVITDSGGLQKEAYLAGVQCLTLRSNTEWTETVEQGWNVLVDVDPARALQALEREPPREHPQLYGDGRAGERVLAALTLHAR
jgi:UDP-N-acetylglucosamine 2-epimerase (non-hydrolysing)/UDP-GlcNAc3NAcA epimerase